MDLAAIDNRLNAEEATCRVVVETPKGSRCKCTSNSPMEAMVLSGLFPSGMSFPLDFGMVPVTLANDGDLPDILVTGDEPAAVWRIVDVRILGASKAEQTERDRTFRDDRLTGHVALSVSYEHANHIGDLDAPLVEHLGRRFTNYNALQDKGFVALSADGLDEVVALIETASNRRTQSWR